MANIALMICLHVYCNMCASLVTFNPAAYLLVIGEIEEILKRDWHFICMYVPSSTYLYIRVHQSSWTPKDRYRCTTYKKQERQGRGCRRGRIVKIFAPPVNPGNLGNHDNLNWPINLRCQLKPVTTGIMEKDRSPINEIVNGSVHGSIQGSLQ